MCMRIQAWYRDVTLLFCARSVYLSVFVVSYCQCNKCLKAKQRLSKQRAYGVSGLSDCLFCAGLQPKGSWELSCARKLPQSCKNRSLMQPHTASGMRTEYKVDKVPFFKHSEEFRLGRETIMGRRDKKSGQQRAFLREVPEGLQIDIQLEQPFPGSPLLALNRR